jgi:hypothetical protein
MLPVISALLALASFGLGHLCAWNTWPCGINWRFTDRLFIALVSIRLIGCSGRGWLGSGQVGARPWYSSSPAR